MRGQIAVERLERSQMKRSIPDFRPGDTIRVGVRVKEGERERTQAFEGVCIRRAGGGANETFTVRKISYGVGVERTFYLHSPNVSEIHIRRAGKSRRARLYYLRERVGKRARVRKERHLRVSVPVTGAPRLSADEATAAAEAAAAQEDKALPVEPETETTAAAPSAGEPTGETADKA